MVRELCRDTMLLSQKAREAGLDDLPLAEDLQQTLDAHRDHCVGMACNMIGYPVRIIAIVVNGPAMLMLNPKLIRKEKPYAAEEGCLSLTGVRKAERYRTIRVRWQDIRFKNHEMVFTGFAAQVIQHEMDHLEGILI